MRSWRQFWLRTLAGFFASAVLSLFLYAPFIRLVAAPLERTHAELTQPPPPMMGRADWSAAVFSAHLALSLLLSAPWMFWQFYSAVRNCDHRIAHWLASLSLFFVGTLIGYLALPLACQGLLLAESSLSQNYWLAFALLLPVMTGFLFQLPLMLRHFDPSVLREKRRLAYFALAVLAAVVVPVTSPVPMICLWLPMCAFYEMGCLLNHRVAPQG